MSGGGSNASPGASPGTGLEPGSLAVDERDVAVAVAVGLEVVQPFSERLQEQHRDAEACADSGIAVVATPGKTTYQTGEDPRFTDQGGQHVEEDVHA